VRALAARANRDDVPALIRPPDDEDFTIGREVLATLARFPDARAVPPVARHLADPDARTQNDAVRALKPMGAIAGDEVPGRGGVEAADHIVLRGFARALMRKIRSTRRRRGADDRGAIARIAFRTDSIR
jgi:hypothetical protein